jgi:hypothetical protein
MTILEKSRSFLSLDLHPLRYFVFGACFTPPGALHQFFGFFQVHPSSAAITVIGARGYEAAEAPVLYIRLLSV